MNETIAALRTALDMVRSIADDIQDYNPVLKNTRDMLHRRADELGGGIDALAAERERLQAVVEAARVFVHDAETDHHLATNWATERLKAALDALKGD